MQTTECSFNHQAVDYRRIEEGCSPDTKRAEKSELWKVDSEVQESNPSPWDDETHKLSREDQLQITGQDLKRAVTCNKRSKEWAMMRFTQEYSKESV